MRDQHLVISPALAHGLSQISLPIATIPCFLRRILLITVINLLIQITVPSHKLAMTRRPSLRSRKAITGEGSTGPSGFTIGYSTGTDSKRTLVGDAVISNMILQLASIVSALSICRSENVLHISEVAIMNFESLASTISSFDLTLNNDANESPFNADSIRYKVLLRDLRCA
jgi:hypothetical protein